MSQDNSETNSEGIDNKYDNEDQKKLSHNKSALKYYHKIKDNKIICEICGGQYISFTKSKHNNTKKHKNAEQIKLYREKINNLEIQIIKSNEVKTN